jgi:hypothetical protein
MADMTAADLDLINADANEGQPRHAADDLPAAT